MTKYLDDYKPFEYELSTTELCIVLEDVGTTVESTLSFTRKDQTASSISLDGENLELLGIKVNGRELSNNEYQLSDHGLTIFDVPESFQLEIKNKIDPGKNQTKVGLYKSNDVFCTQCEAEAFRSITYYPDRPDVLSKFNVTVDANAENCPVVLSNGNKIKESVEDGRRVATFEDPFPKPSYLFALAAGDFNRLDDEFITQSGRNVALTIFLENRDPEAVVWAMECLKRSMAWDEQVYGREYDLDQFYVVGVDHFIFGAMENKGLNIFNSSVLLATPDMATDLTYRRIEGIIAHEYFHNWSGDRVTCRDWFQLCLKEGFTVMRDTHFSADMNGSALKYIEVAQDLRQGQFPEDKGPQVHAVRPSFYETINNNYTRTVYDKGAQVVRMLSILLGAKKWRETTDLYFSKYDGQAVTIEDFLECAEVVSKRDLSQFKLWYTQSGHPTVRVTETVKGGLRELHVTQTIPPTPDQPVKLPMQIPFAVGIVENERDLLGKNGATNPVDVDESTDARYSEPDSQGTMVFDLREASHRIRFNNVPDSAQLSVFRGFSAPVTLDYRTADLYGRWLDIALNDTDGFNRHEAVQTAMVTAIGTGDEEAAACVDKILANLLERALDASDSETKELLCMNLAIPNEIQVLDDYPGSDLDEVIERRKTLLRRISTQHEQNLVAILERNQEGENQPYSPSNDSIARRTLVQIALFYLRHHSSPLSAMSPQRLRDHYVESNNLTDRLAYLQSFIEQNQASIEERQGLLEDFYTRWCKDPVVLDRWYQLQASSRTLGTLSKVVQLSEREPDEGKSPNRVNAVWGAWSGNVEHFHKNDGSGYQLLAQTVSKWDGRSPQVAARLIKPLVNWHRFDSNRQKLLKEQLQYLKGATSSIDVVDLIDRSLAFKPSTINA